jgi:hypothetical protein
LQAVKKTSYDAPGKGSMNTALIWFFVVILLGVLGGLLVGLNHRLAGTRAVIECYIPDVSRPPA